MSLRLEDIAFLRGATAQRILADCAQRELAGQQTLQLLGDLRTSLQASEAAAIVSTLQLRRKATRKFPCDAGRMLFTDAALQQASQPQVSRYRASQLPAGPVLDLCCGVGADSLAFARGGRAVQAVDSDSVLIAIARHNAAALGLEIDFVQADLRHFCPSGAVAVFFDPARRDSRGRRIHHVERYEPPLALARGWQAPAIAIKLSPAVDLQQLAGYGGQVEFISLRGRLVEALLWMQRAPAPPMATLLTDSGSLHMRFRELPPAPISAPRAWLLEPDPALLRAGLVQQLAHELGACQLDASIAYLTTDEPVASPWARAWRVLDWMPFQLKRLRRYFRRRGVGLLTIKKRGFALSPEELRRKLRLKRGGEARVLVMTRYCGQPIAIICAENPAPAPATG